MTTVLDTYALLAYLGEEPGCDTVRDLLADAAKRNTELLMSCVNVAEVFYIAQRKHGRAKLAELDKALEALPIEFVDADLALAKEAAFFKATKKMSLADCFATALAKVRGGRVVTGDSEFVQVEAEVEVLWL